jgi:threonine dehydrogenase-like Zn-dependent dehydrogenase
MRGAILYKAGDVRVEQRPEAAIENPTDAVIRITRACICGSDLWPFNDMAPLEGGRPMGHEAIALVEVVGTDVRRIKVSDLVIMPFAFSDGACMFCDEGLPTSCLHGGFFGNPEVGGAQAEALRIPQADGALYPIPVRPDDALNPSLLTLSDVMGTGHHAALCTKVKQGVTAAITGSDFVMDGGVTAAYWYGDLTPR